MKTTLLSVLAITALVFVGIGSAAADDWFVAKHTSGLTTVTDRVPGFSWNIIRGPYASWDEAARAGNVDRYAAGRVMPVNPVPEFK